MTWRNTVGCFPSLSIISWDNLRTDSEAQRRNVSFSVTIVNNDGSCWGLWSIVRTHAFGRQQALSVNHYSAKYLLDSSMCWGEKSLFVCFVFLLKLFLKIHLRASYTFRLSVFLHQPFFCVSSANIRAFTHNNKIIINWPLLHFASTHTLSRTS